MRIADIFKPEFPMVVNSDLACLVGLDESIFLQQLNYWLDKYRFHPDHQHDGNTWIYNTADDWRTQFRFWSDDKIGRITRDLEKRGLIKTTSELNKHKYDRTKWFTIDLNTIECLIESESHNDNQLIDMTHDANLQNAICKTAECNLQKSNMQSADLQDLYHRLHTDYAENSSSKPTPPAAALKSVKSSPPNPGNLSPEIQTAIAELPQHLQVDARQTIMEEKKPQDVVLSAIHRFKGQLASDPGTECGWLRKSLKGDWGRKERQKQQKEQAEKKGKETEDKEAKEWFSGLTDVDRERWSASAKWHLSGLYRRSPTIAAFRRWQQEDQSSMMGLIH